MIFPFECIVEFFVVSMQVLGYVIDCQGNCEGQCNRCWVRL